jgi:tetratricopeptide (TPR) repeat protein
MRTIALVLGLLFLTTVHGVGPSRAEVPAAVQRWIGEAQLAAAKKDYPRAIALLTEAARQQPKAEVIIQLANVLVWAGRTTEAIPWFRKYFALKPDDSSTRLAFADALSWAKTPKYLAQALAIFDTHLTSKPADYEVLLKRARVRSWAGRTKEALADYRRYLGARPNDARIRLELAQALSWTKGDKDALAQAVEIYAQHLRANPKDDAVVLRLAQVCSWAGRFDEAITSYRAYLARHDQRDVWLELAKTYAWAGRSTQASEAYLAYSARGGDEHVAALGRAQVLRWIGRYAEARALLEPLSKRQIPPKLRDEVELELARLHAQEGRHDSALTLVDGILARSPGDEEARKEKENLSKRYRPQVKGEFTYLRDKSGIELVINRAEGEYHFGRMLSAIVDAGIYRIASAEEGLWVGMINAGVRLRPMHTLELEAALGPRMYEYFSASFGLRTSISAQPFSFISGKLSYSYDDVYHDMYQPASVAAQIRGHTLAAQLSFSLPYQITLSGQATGRFLEPDNQGINLSATAMIGVWKM